MTANGFSPHNHTQCETTLMARAEAHCTQAGLRLTPVRRRVLEILLSGHQAMGAYEILEKLAAEGLGSKPPVVYRALEFLTTHGFAHRLERLNAYTACAHPESGGHHHPAFLICRACKAVSESELPLTGGTLDQAAHESGFTIEQVVVEAEGICPICQAHDHA